METISDLIRQGKINQEYIQNNQDTLLDKIASVSPYDFPELFQEKGYLELIIGVKLINNRQLDSISDETKMLLRTLYEPDLEPSHRKYVLEGFMDGNKFTGEEYTEYLWSYHSDYIDDSILMTVVLRNLFSEFNCNKIQEYGCRLETIVAATTNYTKKLECVSYDQKSTDNAKNLFLYLTRGRDFFIENTNYNIVGYEQINVNKIFDTYIFFNVDEIFEKYINNSKAKVIIYYTDNDKYTNFMKYILPNNKRFNNILKKQQITYLNTVHNVVILQNSYNTRK